MKYALIIANTEYTDPSLARLSAPGRDAEDFARVLREKEIAAFDDVKVLLNNPEPQVREAIDEFFDQKKTDDLLVLYFSGHGVRDEMGSLYLALKNTTRARLRATALKSDFIREAMDQSRSKRIVLILDCCNSGAFAQGTKAMTGGSVGTASAFEGTGYGRIVLTASDSTQFAWEGDRVIGETQNSLFTHFLVKGLEGEADHDYDGRITVDELFDYAYEQIVMRTPKQTPGKWSYKQQGEIVLRQSVHTGNIKPISLPNELIEAIEDSRTFVREGAVGQLEKLAKGKNLGLARVAREALEKMAAEDDSRRVAQIAAQALETIRQAEQLAAQKVEEERLAREKIELQQKADAERKAREDAQRLAAQKAMGEQLARERIEAEQKADAERKARAEVSRKINFKPFLAVGGITIALFILFVIGKPIFENLPVSSPNIGSKQVSPKDGMVMAFVPGGEFTMGGNVNDDEKPVHKVTLDSYWIDQTEVTNAMYAKCVETGACQQPSDTSSSTRSSYYGNSEFDDYPVIYVDWYKARAYCEWVGRRLSTEAEWEKAASWDDKTKTKRLYPWGDSIDCSFANYWGKYNGCVGDTTKVKTYPTGVSPYGAYDMAGNVWEWVSSLYNPYPYGANDGREELSASGSRVLRGGSWNAYDFSIRTAFRDAGDPSNSDFNLGFRCARSYP